MCDKEFKELVKIAVEKLKDESVLKLLKADASYQKDSNNEGDAEDAYNQLDLTEKQESSLSTSYGLQKSFFIFSSSSDFSV
ncbi:hypothetical protein C815_00876 [Firmicutes bacterium M10-2]|nr:hypothetical protein C815_00876 [Firmicutes bacterium M10-2]